MKTNQERPIAAAPIALAANVFHHLLNALACLVACSWSLCLSAQNVTFAGVQTALPVSGLATPSGIAIDRAGDIFIADTNNNQIVELPRTSTGYGAQTTLLASGLALPFGVAVDSAGNLFIADTYNGRVLELPFNGGGYGVPQPLPFVGLGPVFGVAVDGAGNVYAADSNNNRVLMLPQTTMGFGGPGGMQEVVPAVGLASPYGVAVDSAGDVFIADGPNGRVVELPYLTTFRGASISIEYGTQTTLPATGLGVTSGVAVDGAGDVFITDKGHDLALELPLTATGYGPQRMLGVGLGDVFGVAVDRTGNAFITDALDNQVVEVVTASSVRFGSANICAIGQTLAPCSQTLTLNYDVDAATNFGAPTILGQSPLASDFNVTSTTCSGTVASGSVCLVPIGFAPTKPGLLTGAVKLVDSSGNLLAETLLYGHGEGPAIAFDPGTQVAIGPARGEGTSNWTAQPSAVAVNSAGDVFIAEDAVNQVLKIPANGGPSVLLGSGLSEPSALALDGADNIFIADTGNDQVVEIDAVSGAQTTVPFSGLSDPYGVAVDAAGNIFASDLGNNRVVELPITGSPQVTVGTGLAFPEGLAVDAAGDLFVADLGNNRVEEITPAGVQTTVAATELSIPTGVAVNAAGSVFVTDSGNNRLLEVSPNATQRTLGTGIVDPQGLALDREGDLFVVNEAQAGDAAGEVLELVRSQPPALTFGTTGVGTTSSDSPQVVTAENVGTELLLLGPGLIIDDPDFLQAEASGQPRDCREPSFVEPGTTCGLALSFVPLTPGSLSGTAVLTDNTLNVGGSTQTIPLYGAGVGPTAQISATSLGFGTIPFGTADSLSLTVTNIGGGTLTVAPSINGPSYKVTSSTCSGGVTTVNSCTLQVQFAPVAIGTHNDILTLQTNGPANPSIALKGIATGVGTEMETPLQFATIPFGSSKVLLVTITNVGVPGSVKVGTAINGPSYKALTTAQNTCMGGIAASQRCTLPVEFDPVAVGTHNDVLTLTPSGGAAISTISLKGIAD